YPTYTGLELTRLFITIFTNDIDLNEIHLVIINSITGLVCSFFLLKPTKPCRFATTLIHTIVKEAPDSTSNNGSMQRLKYMQLVDYVMTQIEQNKLAINDRLPSLNQLTAELHISKETALKGLQY